MKEIYATRRVSSSIMRASAVVAWPSVRRDDTETTRAPPLYSTAETRYGLSRPVGQSRRWLGAFLDGLARAWRSDAESPRSTYPRRIREPCTGCVACEPVRLLPRRDADQRTTSAAIANSERHERAGNHRPARLGLGERRRSPGLVVEQTMARPPRAHARVLQERGQDLLYIAKRTTGLTVRTRQTTTTASTSVELADITAVSREDLKPYCLAISTAAKTYYLALRSDEELYGWLDDVYERSPLMGVSSPTNFVHQVHVGFDPVSGAFTGLPEQWTRLLTSSAITKEDYAKNPQAVLDVLEFYTDIQKRERDDYGMGATSMGMTDVGAALPNAQRSLPPGAIGAKDPRGYGTSSPYAQRQQLPPLPQDPLPAAPSRSPVETRPGGSSAPTFPRPLQSASAAQTSSRPLPPGAAAGSAAPPPRLMPGRAAPAAPPRQAPPPPASTNPQLKPLLAGTGHAASPAQPGRYVENGGAPSGPKPLRLLAPDQSRQNGAAPHAGPSGDAALPGPLQAAMKAEKANAERRVSSMSEAQILAKLRSVCSREDPNLLYSKIKKVGQGASGSVFVAKVLADGSKVAIKQMDLSHQQRKELIVNEILVMKESHHVNIVNFLDSFLIGGAELWVVMEFMEGGALTDIIDSNTLTEEQISCISNEVRTFPVLRKDLCSLLSFHAQTCKGLQHLHARSIIHRDIKSDNVLLDARGHVKISESRSHRR